MSLSNIDQHTLLQASLECTLAAVGVYDLDGVMHACNSRYRNMLVRFCDVADGNLLKSGLLPPHFFERIKNGPVTYVVFFDKNDHPQPTYAGGQVNNINISHIIIDGKPAGYNVSVMDITNQVKQSSQLELYKRASEMVLKCMTGGLVFLTPDYTVKWKGVDSIYGSEKGEKMYRVGTHCYEHFGVSSPCEGCPVTQCMRTQERTQTIFHDTSNDTDLSINVLPMREKGQTIGYLMELRDVTVREQAKRNLEVALDRAQQSDRMKSAFISNISHEIRTPMNAMVGFTELLCGDAAYGLTEDEKTKYLNVIQQNTLNLNQIIDDLILLSEFQSEQYVIHKTEVDIADLLTKCTESKAVTKQPDVEIKVEIEPKLEHKKITTDPHAIHRILFNYFTNACKFTQHGTITIAARPLNDMYGNWISFSVTDTGCGIPKDKCKEVFGKFFKVDTFIQGTGLGLTICAEAARLLGGRAYLDTNYTQGARFVFDFPLTKSKTPTLADLV